MPYPAKIDADRLGCCALAVVEEQGWEHWSLRDVAARLGVAPNALYGHVADRDALVVEIGAAAAEELRAAITRDADGAAGTDPVARLVAMAGRYLDFAVARPAAYLAFVRAKPAPTDSARTAWDRCWQVVRGAVEAAVPNAPDACGFALWAMLHGRADLTLGPGPGPGVDPRAGVEHAVVALVEGFRGRGSVASPFGEPGR